MVQAHIFFSGRVQGVGFRYTTQRLAQSHQLMGWVKNLADGRVEAIVEGQNENIDMLCHDLQQHFGKCIESKEMITNNTLNHFKDFRITY